MSWKIVIATGNAHKFEELQELLKLPGIEWLSLKDFGDLPDVIEDGDTFEANAQKKAIEYAKATGEWVIADDSGIEIDALEGAPGIYSARFAGKHGDDAANNLLVLEKLQGLPPEQRGAQYVCVLTLASPEGVCVDVRAHWRGQIATALQGEGGFGYDPLFYLPELDQTVGELPAKTKQHLSHRAQAAAKMLEILKKGDSHLF